ncbi:hypothetical protein [Paraburkholderia sp. BL6665CI2N2]|nr:hypothetical protein [Paraburkholderia sp. BL6665CI2N2]
MKHHWRRFIACTKETPMPNSLSILGGYGTKFQVNFSWTLS